MDKLDDATDRNLYATGAVEANGQGRRGGAYMADDTVKVYYRPG